MAKRGFDTADILPSEATLNIPHFKWERDQLFQKEIDETAGWLMKQLQWEYNVLLVK